MNAGGEFSSVRAGMAVVSVAALGMLLGGLLPWASVGAISVSGDSTTDGMATTGCALVALLMVGLLWAGGRAVPLLSMAMLVLVGAAVLGVIDGHSISRVTSDAGDSIGKPTVGAGLWLSTICAAVGAVGALFAAGVQPTGRPSVASQQEIEPLEALFPDS